MQFYLLVFIKYVIISASVPKMHQEDKENASTKFNKPLSYKGA